MLSSVTECKAQMHFDPTMTNAGVLSELMPTSYISLAADALITTVNSEVLAAWLCVQLLLSSLQTERSSVVI